MKIPKKAKATQKALVRSTAASATFRSKALAAVGQLRSKHLRLKECINKVTKIYERFKLYIDDISLSDIINCILQAKSVYLFFAQDKAFDLSETASVLPLLFCIVVTLCFHIHQKFNHERKKR